MRGEGVEGEEKDGEIWNGFVVYPGIIVVRLGFDADYDRLEDFANHHKLKLIKKGEKS